MGDQGVTPSVLGALSKARADINNHCSELVVGDGEYSCVVTANAIIRSAGACVEEEEGRGNRDVRILRDV